MYRCTSCLNASTRPRIEFDENGVCNACQWMKEKQTLDWSVRQEMLNDLLKRHRGRGPFDCIVTVSGGKDGSYVAHSLKTQHNLNPLCLTIRPPLASLVGEKNLKAFVDSGFEHIHLSVNASATRKLDKIGFLEYGQGYFGWMTAVHTAVLRIAQTFDIKLVFYSEDGEIEYGGYTENKEVGIYGIDYMKKAYLSGTYEHVMRLADLPKHDRYWFEFPNDNDGNFLSELEITHYSFYEAWDPYRNYLVAKNHCGLQESEDLVKGTFTNFAQTDQELASLHYYLMYLKFGFGRATQDAGIEIRRGAMTREQAVNLVALYDNQPPLEAFETFAEYFQITMDEFQGVLDRFANKDLFEKVDGIWEPKFKVA